MTDIEALLPHRGAILLVDEIISLTPGVAAQALHHIDEDEPCFSQNPRSCRAADSWPRTLLVEFVGQTAAALCAASEHNLRQNGCLPLFAGSDGAQFFNDAFPGECVTSEVFIDQASGNAFFITGSAHVNDRVLCQVGQALVVYASTEHNDKEKKWIPPS